MFKCPSTFWFWVCHLITSNYVCGIVTPTLNHRSRKTWDRWEAVYKDVPLRQKKVTWNNLCSCVWTFLPTDASHYTIRSVSNLCRHHKISFIVKMYCTLSVEVVRLYHFTGPSGTVFDHPSLYFGMSGRKANWDSRCEMFGMWTMMLCNSEEESCQISIVFFHMFSVNTASYSTYLCVRLESRLTQWNVLCSNVIGYPPHLQTHVYIWHD